VSKPYVVTRESLPLQGVERTFTVVAPERHDPSPPLILAFHGSQQSSRVFRKFTAETFDAAAVAAGALVAYPDAFHRHFNDSRRGSTFESRRQGIDDVAFTAAIIRHMTRAHHVDPARVFVVGYSNGGQMVIRLLHEAPKLLAGAAIIAATQPAPSNFLLTDRPTVKPRPIRLMAIHGTADPLAPYAGGEASLWGSESRGEVLSAVDSASYFARRNGISTDPVTERRFEDVEVTRWSEQGREPVELWSVEGMGHVVPSPHEFPPQLGSGTRSFIAAEAITHFWGLSPAPFEG